MKKWLSILLSLVLTLSFFSVSQAEEQATVTFWLDDMTDARMEMVEKIISTFEASHPNIKIEFTGLPEDSTDKLMLAFEAGIAPDILNITSKNIATYIENGYVTDLTDLYAEKGNNAILESAIASATAYDRENNRLYYLPSGCNFFCLWARSDWFAEKGLASPATWDEFFADVEALTDKAAGRYGIALRGGSGAATNLEMLMYSYSGITNYFTEDGVCTVNDPKHVEFVDRYLSLYNVCSGEGDINYGWTQLAGAFQTGVAAIIQHNTGSSDAHYAAFNGDLTKFEAVPFPTSQTGNRVMQSLSWDGFAINSTAKDKEAAWEFLYYLCAAEGAAIYTEAIGLVPCVTELLTSEDSYVQNPEKPWMQTAAAVITDPTTLFYDCPTYMPSYSGALSSEIDPLVQQTMAGELTAQELLDTWAQIMNDMYAEEGK